MGPMFWRIAGWGHNLRARLDMFETTVAAISLWFAAILLVTNNTNGLAHVIPFSVMCLFAASFKIVGMLWQWRKIRITGLVLGAMFWIFLAAKIILTFPFAISYGGYLILAVAQTIRACQLANVRRR